MSPDHPDELIPFRGAPFSPHLRWLEVAGGCAVELLRLKQRAKALACANPHNPEVFHGFEQDTINKMSAMVCNGLGWEITHNTDLPETNPDDRWVYVGNHPTLTASWSWAAFMEAHFGSNIVAVGKREMIDNPLSRWALGDMMMTAHKGIFIDRKNRAESIQEIREHAARVLTSGTGAALFADEHRPYPRRIRRQQREWDRKKPDLEVSKWMTHTCFPKSGGLWNFAQVIDHLESVRFLDCTVIEPPTVYRYGGELHFDVREVSRRELLGAPESEEHLRTKLVELWQRKNAMIRERRA